MRRPRSNGRSAFPLRRLLLASTSLLSTSIAQHPPPSNLIFHTTFSVSCSDPCGTTCSQSTGIFIDGDCYASSTRYGWNFQEPENRWYSYNVVTDPENDGSLLICKHTYTDPLCANQASDCWEAQAGTLPHTETGQKWAREPAPLNTCLVRSQVREQVLEREIFDVHLDWCVENHPGAAAPIGVPNIFSHGGPYPEYTLPLVMQRYYPDEEACEEGYDEIDIAELPEEALRPSRYFDDEELCVTENRTNYGGYASLRYFCRGNELLLERYPSDGCQGNSVTLLAGACLRNFALDGETVLRWSRVGCNWPAYMCKDITGIASYRYNQIEQPSASPTNGPSPQPSGTPTRSPVPTANPSSYPSIDPSYLPSTNPSVRGGPSEAPVSAASMPPSQIPSTAQSTAPTSIPSMPPTNRPTHLKISPDPGSPSMEPITARPTESPSEAPIASPSGFPSTNPSLNPSAGPGAPSHIASTSPSATQSPSNPTSSEVSLAPSSQTPNITNSSTHNASSSIPRNQDFFRPDADVETADKPLLEWDEGEEAEQALDESKGKPRPCFLHLLLATFILQLL